MKEPCLFFVYFLQTARKESMPRRCAIRIVSGTTWRFVCLFVCVLFVLVVDIGGVVAMWKQDLTFY